MVIYEIHFQGTVRDQSTEGIEIQLDNVDSMQRRCGGVRTVKLKVIRKLGSLLGGTQLEH